MKDIKVERTGREWYTASCVRAGRVLRTGAETRGKAARQMQRALVRVPA